METKTNFFEKYWYLSVILAIVLVGIVGSLWFYNQKVLQERATQIDQEIEEMTVEEITTQSEIDEQTMALEEQSDSDEITHIETDLQSTDFSNLDKEITDIEYEIDNP